MQTTSSFEGTINEPQTKYSASKGTCVGTAAILDFFLLFLSEKKWLEKTGFNCTYQIYIFKTRLLSLLFAEHEFRIKKFLI